MPFDFKKVYREFYLPARRPHLIKIPPMSYLAVRGHGDPNAEDGEYKQSIGLLYAIAFTLKMSHKTSHKIAGFFEYVVPPLEGFWWQDALSSADSKAPSDSQASSAAVTQTVASPATPAATFDYNRKSDMNFISVIRLPDFITRADFDWAIQEATHKKKQDFSKVEFFHYEEGLVVQCLHLGSYDDEPATIAAMDQYAVDNNCVLALDNPRYHHEIYLSDPRRCAPDKLKTVLRHPVKKIS